MIPIAPGRALVIGSIGGPDDLAATTAETARRGCDIVEVRLDLLAAENGAADPASWSHLRGLPLLFTARRREEGGALELDAAQRATLLQAALIDAAMADIEVAGIDEMQSLIGTLEVPWIASFHDFARLPETAVLEDAAQRAKAAGAAAFKVAARVHTPADLARLAEFQLADHGLPVATMGMGPLAPVSRLLCAQCGSVLNYGFLGEKPTAPGQWDAAFLREAIRRLAPRF
jgi:3-dehydroquinate dehydratase I